ncbi:crotonase/enoyl-CoA hydratase family protein [Sulfitobacter guttiformis]|uniref:Enoyl-CoA hydratase/carnithine racemase n=1 Tax=Sulfitobacter guttiformis TaxID=74349 RepID=A0A420DP06_9RHOB|nr:crotonase/enoyl-CoA hydratase family protein [Sulfitobacter guttiformis]RKE95917.1 enoyl-CoA hydratase/carnithine racemase [Sulfitobacter guttiformis]
MSRVSVTYENHIAHVRLTRADKMNAVDQEMITAVIAAGNEVAASDARVVIVSGEGKAFCAGIDISGLSGMIGKDPAELLMPRTHGADADGQNTTNQWQEFAMVWARMDIPVIAAVQGVCFGAGIQLALGADIRIAAPDASFAVMEMKWGIVPDMGGMVLLPRLVRSDVLRLMTYTAEPISAEQAERWGLVTQLADNPLAAAQALAETIAGKSPSAVRAAKRLIAVAQTADEAAVLDAESREQVALMGKPHQMEVVAAAFGKRAAVFK